MSLFREAIVDEKGQVDVVNLALFWLMLTVLGAITFSCAMSLLAWYSACTGTKHECSYDPQPLGVAVGAICTGFSVAVGSVGAYMRLQQPRADKWPDTESRSSS